MLIKLEPDIVARKMLANREKVLDGGLGSELEKHGIDQLKSLFPEAVAAREGDVVSLSEGTTFPKPDLTPW